VERREGEWEIHLDSDWEEIRLDDPPPDGFTGRYRSAFQAASSADRASVSVLEIGGARSPAEEAEEYARAIEGYAGFERYRVVARTGPFVDRRSVRVEVHAERGDDETLLAAFIRAEAEASPMWLVLCRATEVESSLSPCPAVVSAFQVESGDQQ